MSALWQLGSSVVTLRALGREDEDGYRALWIGALTEHATFFRTAAKDDLCPGIPTHCSIDSFTLGAYLASRLVGIVSLDRDQGAKLRHKALLFRMFVHPDAAGRGVGKALLREVIARADTVGDLRQLHLTVLATNLRARALYRSVGFNDYALEAGAVRLGDQYVDEVQMMRLLHDIPI